MVRGLLKLYSGSLAPGFNPHTSSKDEVIKCRRPQRIRAEAPMLNPRLQSASGISFKSQVLYLLVYITRYLGQLSSSSSKIALNIDN